MKTLLLYADRDFDVEAAPPWNESALVQDLALDILFKTMGRGDSYLIEIAKKGVLNGSLDVPSAILYRQEVFKDSLANELIVRELYSLAVDAIESEKSIHFGYFSRYPGAILSRGIDLLRLLVVRLRRLKAIADEHSSKFHSAGFRRLFAMIQAELEEGYITSIEAHLTRLGFRDGMLLSARLGEGNRGKEYTLRKHFSGRKRWIDRLLGERRSRFSFEISDRDESGMRILSQLKDIGQNSVANAVAQSADHVMSFFSLLRAELGFYIGCLNLQHELKALGQPTCLPVPSEQRERHLTFRGLYDAVLALRTGQGVVGNDLVGDGKSLGIITGANQGGKSTFLRSIGLSHLMMQCGMFVPAESFRANVCSGIVTHFAREEDAAMKSGKFDEELRRMSDVVDHMRRNALILLNESFAATKGREGSAIARQIVEALVERGVKVFFVTHLYEFADGIYNCNRPDALFLRAERDADGHRSFKLLEGGPQETSFGEDLYNEVFGENGEAARREGPRLVDSH